MLKLFKNLGLSFVSTFVKLIASYASIKITAFYLGVEAVAIQSNFTNILAVLMTFSSLSLETGVTVIIAKHYDNKQRITTIIASIVKLCLLVTILVSLLFIILNLTGLIRLTSLRNILILSTGLPILTIGSISMSVINGLKAYKIYYLINIISGILTIALNYLLIYFFKINGLLFAVTMTHVTTGIMAIYYISKEYGFQIKKIKIKIKDEDRKALISLSMMGLFSTVFLPLTQISIRSSILNNFSMHTAGIWDSANKISSLFIVVFNTTFQVYFLSRLSSLRKVNEVFSLIKAFYSFLMPLLLIYMLVFHFGYGLFIKIIFTSEFNDITQFYPYQQIGDMFRVLSYIYGYLLWVHKRVYYYLFIESIYMATLYYSSIFLGEIYGFKGFGMGYMTASILYFVLLYMYKNKIFILYENNNSLKQ